MFLYGISRWNGDARSEGYFDPSMSMVVTMLYLGQGLGPSDKIKIFSLASSLSTRKRPPTKTATVMFQNLPAAFDNEKDEWVLPTRDMGYECNVIVDVYFLEFTTLNDPERNIHTLE